MRVHNVMCVHACVCVCGSYLIHPTLQINNARPIYIEIGQLNNDI